MLFREMSVGDFLENLASGNPTPGGGSAAAMVGAMAASLTLMALEISARKKNGKGKNAKRETEDLKIRLSILLDDLKENIDRDAESYNSVLAAVRISKTEYELRHKAIQGAYKNATLVPLQTAVLVISVLKIIKASENLFSGNVCSDVKTAKALAKAAFKSAIANVEVNLAFIEFGDWVDEIKKHLGSLKDCVK